VDVVEDETANEHVPTTMELALRRAMEGTVLESELARQRDRKRKKGAGINKQQEEILARTLQQRKH